MSEHLSGQGEADGSSGGDVFPPTGWVTGREAAARLGISFETLTIWESRGRVGPSKLVKNMRARGAWTKVYSEVDVERVRAARQLADASFPPVGFLNADAAGARLGVNGRQIREWVKLGVFSYDGELVEGPGSRQYRLWEITRLDQAYQAMRDAVAARATLPAGYVGRDEAAAFFGIAPDTLALWYTNGRLRCGKWVKSASGKRVKIYPIAGLAQAKAKMDADRAARASLPDGFTDIWGVCEMFGITRAAWIIWKRHGKVPRGRKWQSATQTYLRIYDVNELKQVMAELRGPDKVFRLGGDAKRFHIPEGWVTASGAGEILGASEKSILRWEAAGLIPRGRVETGQRIRIYPRAALEQIVAEFGRYAPPYPDPERPGCYRVPLAGHDIARREALIDSADVEKVDGRRFHFTRSSDESMGRVVAGITQGGTRLDALILGVTGDDERVGHRNDDPLDCRRENLIVGTRSDRCGNMRKCKTFCGRAPTSRFKGVCWDKSSERWVAYIKKEGVTRSLGRYHDEIAAAQAYDDAAREVFGEHARPNFPDGVDAYLMRQEAEATSLAA